MEVRSRQFSYCSKLLALLFALNFLGCTKSKPEVSESMREAEQDVQTTAPRPELAPEEVVKLQLEAIRDSEGTEEGLGNAYRFNSPEHKERMGTLSRFAAIIRSSDFQPLLDFQAAEFGPPRIVGDRARQIVTLSDEQGNVQLFLFELSKQESGPEKGCWLTDAVYPGSLGFNVQEANSGNQS